MAYAQWVSVTVQVIGFTGVIKNAVHQWGKFYESGNKDNEISPSDIDGTTIASGSSFTINACGREDAASGTEGSFDVYDGDTHVGTYSWDCPWGSKTNSSTWSPGSDSYVGQVTGANLDSGALGNVSLKIAKF